jgi:hypothetical protein
MTSNLQPAGSATVPPPEMVGAVAPSCYRVSLLSGSLEVSARLKNADDLELLIKVLEANKGLFAKADRSGIDAVVKAAETSAKADRLDTKVCAKANGSGTNTPTKADRLTEILTP